MPGLDKDKLEEYLYTIYKKRVHITSISEIGKGAAKDIKGFGYGRPYLIKYKIDNEEKGIVLETMSQNTFGHDHFSDRAQSLIWDHSSFNHLPGHVSSLDVGAFTPDGRIISVGEAEEFFILTEFVEGDGYNKDLEKILSSGRAEKSDEERVKALADYLVSIHSIKKESSQLYTRRIRDLIGHGECIMGLIDNYPARHEFITRELLQEIEESCVRWRWKIKDKGHRLSLVHGDFHPWNILFRKGTDFTVLDRARGEWGEPADDVGTIVINYIFFSLQRYGRLEGPFERLYSLFWTTYMQGTGDMELLKVIQPFLAWRGLVIGNPLWYPTLSLDIRKKLFGFIKNILSIDEFRPEEVNEYIKNV